MLYYYLFSLFSCLLLFFNRKLTYIYVVVGFSFFLIFLPSTGLDYEYYKESYDNAELLNYFPYFDSESILTAEPLYIWYSSFISVITNLQFNFFLAINFLISVFIANRGLSKVGNTDIRGYFYVYLLPVVMPTIFYFSPRSSLSFFLIFLGFLGLFYSNKKRYSIFICLGLLLHSQYILISFYIFLLYFISKKIKNSSIEYIILINFVLSFILFLFLFFIDYFIFFVSRIFSFLPSATVAISKLHYISDGESVVSGFRLTSILSIFVFPVLVLLFTLKLKDRIRKTILFGIIGVVFFGMVVNLAFINDPHVAGRVSRFSDYFSMGVLLPLYFYFQQKFLTLKLVVLIFCLISPFLFKSLYGF